MDLLCYNRGCGQRFDSDQNDDGACLFHPGVPIFHDALKGWSCCKKRTTDFSEFLSIQGCTRGRHSNEKPEEPLRPEVSSEKGETKHANGKEIIYQGPKSAEKLQRERPSSDEAMVKLAQKVSASLAQVLEKLDISNRTEREKKESQVVTVGTRCKNTGCKTLYQGPETDLEVCTYHPGAPVFHEGYKYWNCCCIKTIDFNAFLDQKGCSTDKHCWIPKQNKKKVACRHDWHQTGNTVVVTIYAKNANPEFSTIEANSTVLSCHIQFENDKVFKKDFHLWGVIVVKQSSVNMVPSKVEITLRKADSVAWGKLEDPNFKPEPEPADNTVGSGENEAHQPNWDIDDDDISDSDDDWAYDTPENKKQTEKKEQREVALEEQRKKIEAEMRKAEEDRKKAEEQRREEEEEGFEDLPELDS
ncbi:cysteine and histidine-rich domain-containing protein 1 [Myripristis murdjan]|uniref:cysteine and histidine-rich domain-containing protein 1 n=1 Tax=Myripristis murdjan TaxID=586833 RepID=UPI001175E0CA|nr:cysteine and histidine-rich domain-containing protein 1-like [Myripristis murdjan]